MTWHILFYFINYAYYMIFKNLIVSNQDFIRIYVLLNNYEIKCEIIQGNNLFKKIIPI